ncbi:MAG: hypothetical protein ACE364_06445 [Chlorobiota bacterium]
MVTEVEFDRINKKLSATHNTADGLMFGKRCLKVGRKAFVVLYNDSLVFKIGADAIAKFCDDNPKAGNWNPKGKGNGMKNWLEVPQKYSGEWENLALKSLNFTVEETK